MGIAEVTAYFAAHHMADRVRTFSTSSATVELAAAALSCSPARIAKTLSFFTREGPILVVAGGTARIDNPKFKAQFGEKAKMLPSAEAESLVGHPVGGVCPFAVRQGVRVFLDESLRRFVTVFPACGSANSAIELSIAELEQHTGYAAWVDVCRTAE